MPSLLPITAYVVHEAGDLSSAGVTGACGATVQEVGTLHYVNINVSIDMNNQKVTEICNIMVHFTASTDGPPDLLTPGIHIITAIKFISRQMEHRQKHLEAGNVAQSQR